MQRPRDAGDGQLRPPPMGQGRVVRPVPAIAGGPGGSMASGTVLEIDQVSKRYGDVVAVDDLSLDVSAGELFGFVGRNGAGKTTTMRIVLGVLAPDAGVVRWLGVPLTFEARRRIGYMPEERGLYPKMHVAEQLAYLGELHGMTGAEGREAALGWLDRFGLADRRNAELQALSLGNQQRVQLAAALVFGPDVLMLDEPFAGLDPVAVDVMAGVLRERAEAGCLLYTSPSPRDRTRYRM